MLDLFQKKVVGVTRKRRALSFSVDEEDGALSKGISPYFSPIILSSTATVEVTRRQSILARNITVY